MANPAVLNVSTLPCITMLVIMMFGFACSDFANDKKECADKLATLTSYLPFVAGDTKLPSPNCCNSLREEVNSTKKCLCLLIKDRNDPNLGIKINATLTLSLPSNCHAPANVSECPEILHLAPNSEDAQVFEQFTADGNSSAVVVGNQNSSSNRLRKRKWLERSNIIAGGILSAIMVGI